MNVMGLKCADLVGAMSRMHRHRCHILDLVSPTPERIFFVPAVTISNFPSCSGEATGWGGDPVTPFQANVPVASTA